MPRGRFCIRTFAPCPTVFVPDFVDRRKIEETAAAITVKAKPISRFRSFSIANQQVVRNAIGTYLLFINLTEHD
jgi:hypothetical protein